MSSHGVTWAGETQFTDQSIEPNEQQIWIPASDINGVELWHFNCFPVTSEMSTRSVFESSSTIFRRSFRSEKNTFFLSKNSNENTLRDKGDRGYQGYQVQVSWCGRKGGEERLPARAYKMNRRVRSLARSSDPGHISHVARLARLYQKSKKHTSPQKDKVNQESTGIPCMQMIAYSFILIFLYSLPAVA